jgi:hypothetical protein
VQGTILKYAGFAEGGGKVTVKDVPAKEGPPKIATFMLTLQVFEQPPESGNETPKVTPQVCPASSPATHL